MQNDVLDYFRASCNVLKAGVKAGLTLYDIASEVLCRNDPSGESSSCILSTYIVAHWYLISSTSHVAIT